MLLFPAPNIFAICIIYSPETNLVAGVLLFDETLQVQTGARQSGVRHGVKISNQERYIPYHIDCTTLLLVFFKTLAKVTRGSFFYSVTWASTHSHTCMHALAYTYTHTQHTHDTHTHTRCTRMHDFHPGIQQRMRLVMSCFLQRQVVYTVYLLYIDQVLHCKKMYNLGLL